jgi:UDP-2-acetamido-2,6-beta-L-arabino-hexul-4-ose reductase
MKIIGDGMIAQSFEKYNLKSVCIFASGVSDSNETDLTKYKKEYNLLKKSLEENNDKLFVYFSTLSILRYDYSEYVKHKLFIESYIQNKSNNFLILRLPNIVGRTKSQNQLLPFFYNSLIENKTIQLNLETYRDLLDVEDLPKIVEYCLNKKIVGILNTSLGNKIKVIDIVDYLIKINNIKNCKIEMTHNHQNIEYVNDIVNYIGDLDVITNPYKIIDKYYRK